MIRLLEFHRSPNCAKIRIALNYKGIPFEMEEVSAADRSPMLRAVNWPLVPVILDGEVTMRDSEAILHYLESNYRESPSLTPKDQDEIRRGEALTRDVQHSLRPIMRKIYGEVMKTPEQRDPRALAGIVDQIAGAIEPLEEALAGKDFLLGERISMYDILLACALMPARPRPDYAAQSPMWAFFGKHLAIPESLPNVIAWVDRVLAYDAEPAAAR